MGFLRRLFGGQAVPAQLPKHGDRPNLTAVVDVVPTRLDPSWPVVPTERQPQTLSTDARNELPFEATVCPSCQAEVAKPPKGRKRCTSCGEYMFVRLVDRQRRRLVNSAEAAVLDGADSERQVTEWDEADRAWYRELSAAGLLVSDSPEDGVELDVVGESHYHADLAGLMVALRNDFEATEVTTAARLVREPGNPYDRNAGRVEIHGKLVGYLSRDEAADIQPRLKKTERRTRPTYVLARLGGGRVDHGVVGPIGVTLENLPEDVLD